MYWFTEDNRNILSENGINDNFVWGEIKAVYPVSNFHIVEYESRHDNNEIRYHVYIDKKDGRMSYESFDEAILAALGFKYDGANSQFVYFASKMLGMNKVEK